MMYLKNSMAALAAVLGLTLPFAAQAQTSVAEDFSGTSALNPWYFFNGACLTAATVAGAEPVGGLGGQIPGCVNIGASYYGENLVGGQNGVAGNGQTLPDPGGQGALRFTNGSPGGFHQNGGIVSTIPFSTGQGVSITFKTVTYRGNSGGAGGDGADGISFYLMDSSALNTATITGTSAGDGNGLGSWGGSLGYTCSNANPPYNGLIGAYVAVGIDEYGNFLNGTNWMPGYLGPNPATGDNSALGYGYKPGRIGLRGAGNVAWSWLNTNYPATYPSTFTVAQQQTAVKETCQHGVVWDETTNTAVTAGGAPIPLYDYAPIPGAYVELPAATQIANEAAMNRPAAIPILYRLKITQDNLLSFSYSYNGGAYQSVISGQSILASNGPMPANFLFGFAGSTGGSTNIHEILCFRADPATTADTSAGASEKQSAKLETGVQAFFAFYNPSNWGGRVTASGLSFDAYGNVIVAATPNWDAACDLNGVGAAGSCPTTGVPGPTPAEAPASRVMLTWSGASGIPFQFANLTAGQQGLLTAGDNPAVNCNATTAYATNDRLWYLRGSRACEISSSGVGLFRARAQILGDIIDSSPQWVGPPVGPFTQTWTDRINVAGSLPENAVGAQTYPQYVTAQQSRLNVVYVGSNDGWLHGFRSGSYNADGSFNSAGNDGQEVLAYMPGAIVQTIHSATPNIDFSNSQYGHQFFVDATPAAGDVFYANQWHSWIVGGLGPGGAAIYALDVTNPTPANFTEGNAANLVVGEWTPSTLACANVINCGNNLGNTYGTPTLRRLHDGKWAVIFGNGLGSATGDAGIYIMTIDPNSAARTFYYLSTHTGSVASPNGIAYTTPVDLDGDHITDYVYAGDIQGNVWRFDLTNANEVNWTLTPGPVFKTQGGQPITTAVVAASGAPTAGMQQQLMLLFGTGQKFPLSNASPATYANGSQSLYGVWDWNMGSWNALSSGAKYASLNAAATGLTTPNDYTTAANLQAQTVSVNAATQNRDILANASICWAGQVGCGGAAAQFGWYLNFPGTQEQVIYNPELVAQALTVNSIVPATYSRTSCTSLNDTGFTYVLSALTGGAFNEVFLPPSEASTSLATDPRYTDVNAIGIQTDASGSALIVLNNAGTRFLVMETDQTQGGGANSNNIANAITGLNLPPNTLGRRLSWVERR